MQLLVVLVCYTEPDSTQGFEYPKILIANFNGNPITTLTSCYSPINVAGDINAQLGRIDFHKLSIVPRTEMVRYLRIRHEYYLINGKHSSLPIYFSNV